VPSIHIRLAHYPPRPTVRYPQKLQYPTWQSSRKGSKGRWCMYQGCCCGIWATLASLETLCMLRLPVGGLWLGDIVLCWNTVWFLNFRSSSCSQLKYKYKGFYFESFSARKSSLILSFVTTTIYGSRVWHFKLAMLGKKWKKTVLFSTSSGSSHC